MGSSTCTWLPFDKERPAVSNRPWLEANKRSYHSTPHWHHYTNHIVSEKFITVQMKRRNLTVITTKFQWANNCILGQRLKVHPCMRVRSYLKKSKPARCIFLQLALVCAAVQTPRTFIALLTWLHIWIATEATSLLYKEEQEQAEISL